MVSSYGEKRKDGNREVYNGTALDKKTYKPFTDFRKAEGRLMEKDGTLYYSEKKREDQQRQEYWKDEEFYDYITQMEKVKKAINTPGFLGNKDEIESFEERFHELKVYHLHRAKEANRKIDLAKWYQEAKDVFSDDDFLCDKPIYRNREKYRNPDAPHN